LEQSKLWTKEFVINAFINFFVAVNFYLLMVIISDYAMKNFGSAPSEAGFAASIFIIGALAMRLFAGKLLVRMGYKETLALGVISGLVMTLLYFEANNIYLLLIVRFWHGASFGITTTATATIVAEIIPRKRSGEGIAYFSLSQILATAIGPFLGMFISQHGSYSMMFTVCATALVISLLLVPFLTLRKKELTAGQKKEMHGLKLSNLVEAPVIPISVICLTIFMCYSSIVSFLAVYAQEINLVDAASFFFMVYALVVLISRPIIGRLFDARGENIIMYPAIFIFAAGMFLFSHSHTSYELLLAAILFGIGFGAIQSSTLAIAVKITPSHRMGLANSTYFLFSDIGMGTGPLLVGLIIPFVGYRGMYTVVAVILLACLCLYYLLHGRKAKSRNQIIIEWESN
jgi:MFS family permease